MSKPDVELITFHCLAETNDWEGETWYHYFQDAPGVLDALESIERGDTDFESLETVIMCWDEAERLTNRGHDGYMQEHWFGELTDIEGLRSAANDSLYKGKIRDFGTELFSYEEEGTGK